MTYIYIYIAKNPTVTLHYDSTYNFASPVIRIWIKNELWIVRKGEIKDQKEYKDGNSRQPLQPTNTSASLMVGCEAKQDQHQQGPNLNSLTKVHGGWLIEWMLKYDDVNGESRRRRLSLWSIDRCCPPRQSAALQSNDWVFCLGGRALLANIEHK